MSWLPKILSNYWAPPPPSERVENEPFYMVPKELDNQLQEAIESHLPTEGQNFQNVLAEHFDLTLIPELGGGDSTKVWLVGCMATL